MKLSEIKHGQYFLGFHSIGRRIVMPNMDIVAYLSEWQGWDYAKSIGDMEVEPLAFEDAAFVAIQQFVKTGSLIEYREEKETEVDVANLLNKQYAIDHHAVCRMYHFGVENKTLVYFDNNFEEPFVSLKYNLPYAVKTATFQQALLHIVQEIVAQK